MRIPRLPKDRIASEAAPIRRYRCCQPGGCGWEGTLVATWADTGLERRRAGRFAHVCMPGRANRRFVLCAVIALAAVALSAGAVTLYRGFAPTSLLAQNARAIPFGVSDFGRPLPENHPFLRQGVDGLPGAIRTAAAVTVSSLGASPEVGRLREPPASSEDAPLSLREDCAWGEPGRSPYQGTVRQALKAARLPTDVVALLERKIRDREVSDRLEIRNDKIRGVYSDAAFEPRAIKLTFGKTLCLNSRVNFKPGHVERADLYELVDARGITYSVMVPHVCGNVSVLGPPARRHESPQHVPPPQAEQPRTSGGQGAPSVQTPSGLTSPVDVNSVPEPGTWALLLGGVALLSWFTRRR